MALANTLITDDIIAALAVRELDNALVACGLIHRDYEPEFDKVGESIRIRKPVKIKSTSGAVIASTPNLLEENETFTVASREKVHWAFTTQDLKMKIEDFNHRYVRPGMISIANKIESDLLGLYTGIYNFVGTPGTTPSSIATIGDAGQLLDEEMAPFEERACVMGPAMQNKMTTGDLKGYFNQQLAEDLTRRGFLGQLNNTQFYMGQAVKQHTVGEYSGTPLVNGATAEGATTINIDGWGGSNGDVVLTKGDVFTVAAVNAVNGRTYESTGSLRFFVVTADSAQNASGESATAVSPRVVSLADTSSKAPYATIDVLPADNAAITIKTGASQSQHPQNLMFHPDAFALATIPLDVPRSAVYGASVTYKGLNVRLYSYLDGTNDEENYRLDVLYGVHTINAPLGVRITG
jgi:hypothetical protein